MFQIPLFIWDVTWLSTAVIDLHLAGYYLRTCTCINLFLHNLEDPNKEVMWLLLKPARTPRPFSCILFVGVYHPPGKSAEQEKEMHRYLSDALDSFLCNHPSAGLIITGDFNKMKLSPLCRQFNLRKLIKSATRGRNVLDQILTNMHDLFEEVLHRPPIGRSDHQCLLLTPKIKEKVKPTTRRIRQMKPENIRLLGLKLNLENWSEIYNTSDVDEKVNRFTATLVNLLDLCLPERSIKIHPSDKPWITPQIKREIRLRQQAYTRGDTVRYEQKSEKVSGLVSKAKLRHYRSRVENVKRSDQAKWYKMLYKLTAAEESRGTVSTPETVGDIAERLQTAFSRPWEDIVPTRVPEIEDVLPLLKNNTPIMPSIGQVKSSLKYVNPKKATGGDMIPARLLKRFHEELAPVIHDIICCSIKECKFPKLYKHALITPIPKVNCPNDIDNDFRQVSILPHIAKLIEKHQLLLNKSDILINNTQHGFTENRSTVSALSLLFQNWFNATDNSKEGRSGVHVVFLDFRKAFDLVDHGILLRKLAELNVNKSFWLWTKVFLREEVNRSIWVV